MAAKPQAAGGSALDRLPPVAKVGVALLFVGLIGVLYFVVFYGDVDTQISQAVQREAQLHGELQKAQTSKAEYQKDLEEKTRREQTAREQKRILPDDPEMPAFLSALQGVATISGVNLTSWSPAEETVEEFYAKVPMKLTLTGKFHQIAKFFHGVGQLDRIINVENIRIKNPKANGDEVDVEVECLATAFRATKPGETKKEARPGAARPGGAPR
ncbi:MAG TPA: type 4a pilus biogenesis protein PilO [Minicystis sp.]|nr:type 4a pilus biogenesis protein PilO [Minicystis sp.]